MLLLSLATSTRAELRSALFPADWQPATPDAHGRFLHDFSYAGYHRGEKPIPRRNGPQIDVTAAPYHADATGKTDSTAAIQRALDDAAKAGGGIVYLPAGMYRVTFQRDKNYALWLCGNNVILRGAPDRATRIFCDDTISRQKAVIRIAPPTPVDWFSAGATFAIAEDLPLPTRTLKLNTNAPTTAPADRLSVGDFVFIRIDPTEAFIADLGMSGKWTPASPNLRGMTLARRIVSIDRDTITIDTPTRYPMLVRDNLRVVKPPAENALLQESGIEDLAIGMRQNPKAGMAEEDYRTEGNGAYEIHGSSAVVFVHCENAWATRISSFKPDGNDSIHLHSNGIKLIQSRQVTVADCDMRHPQYRGGGGNGYLYVHASNDNLIRDSLAVGGRHNFDLQTMSCIGNVILRCTSRDPTLASDFHMWFSTANLIDSMTLDGDFLECVYRPYGGATVHGVTGSQNVFWNTRGEKYGRRDFIVQSKQFGHGYIIGTQGPAADVSPDSTGWIEHVGKGEQLTPKSLYEEQLSRRRR